MKDRQILFRNTAAMKGRHIMVRPDNTPLQLLSCGRIILDAKSEVWAESESREVGLICLQGTSTVSVGPHEYSLRRYDALYIPPDTAFEIRSSEGTDLVECSAPSDLDAEAQFVSFQQIADDPQLHVTAGGESSTREVYRLIDSNVRASRLVCGLTLGRPGHWTSWSPHEHASSREEVYLFVDMPLPAFGIQMIYEDLRSPDFVEPVFQDDAVVITRGYHPNVGAPGCGINYIWMMAGLRPEVDREWSNMHFQPEFLDRD